MRLGQYRFNPPLWAIPLVVILVAVLIALGVWQLDRAHYKEHLIAVHKAAQAAGPQVMKIGSEEATPRRNLSYIVHGHYDDAHQLLLANQLHGTREGYRVWTPLVLASGVQIMVDRGWVPKPTGQDAAPPSPPAPGGRVTIKGYWRGFPQPLSFGENKRCNLMGWPRPLNFPDTATVRCQYQRPVADGLLLLAPDQVGGFVRDWDEDSIGLRPWVHYSYAAQWFFFALLVIALFVFISNRRAY
jgi:surfeit locus 1 family protein